MTREGNTKLVVVGVDGSPAAGRALAWAAGYAKATGWTLRAVLSWHYPAAAGPAPIGVAPASVTGDVEKKEHAELDQAIVATLGDSPDVEIERKIAYGHPSEVLIDESEGADLLVVGSRGHGGFSGMLLGSVSMHCVTHAACPVTVVRSPKTG